MFWFFLNVEYKLVSEFNCHRTFSPYKVFPVVQSIKSAQNSFELSELLPFFLWRKWLAIAFKTQLFPSKDKIQKSLANSIPEIKWVQLNSIWKWLLNFCGRCLFWISMLVVIHRKVLSAISSRYVLTLSK